MTYVKTAAVGQPPERRTRRGTWPGVLVLQLALAATAWAQDGQPQRLPLMSLQAGMHVIQAGVARTPQQRYVGLMHRRDLPPNEGMLFIFEQPQQQCFWMRNTPLPLTIAFLADDGRIVNLADMKPSSDDSHCSTEPVRLALEMNQGWFAKRNIKPGNRIKGEAFQR